MELIWHGTAGIEIKTENGQILFDPFVPCKGSAVAVTLEEFDGARDIFVTHGHLDHILSLPQIVKRNPKVRIHCTETPYQTLKKRGVPKRNLVKIRAGEVRKLGDLTIRTIRGKHAVLPKLSVERLRYALRSPARGNLLPLLIENVRCKENQETLFYQVEAEGKTIALMGSMNLCGDVEYPTGADVLILPYNGWEDNYAPAVRMLRRLKPKKVLLDHYDDTFPPITQPLDLTPILAFAKIPVKALTLHETEYI